MFSSCFLKRFFCSTQIQSTKFTDTIFALASGNMKAGISVIRISGPNCLQACQMLEKQHSIRKTLIALDNKALKDRYMLESRRAYYKKLFSLESSSHSKDDSEQIDASLFLYFEGPRSFTGEGKIITEVFLFRDWKLKKDLVELHIHGSRALQKKVIGELSSIESFRIAEPGEFTKRALLNDKLDLLEVEGLSDLLNAETENQRIQSTKQFLGDSSKLLESWRRILINSLAYAEAFIEFESDQDDVEFNILGKTQESLKSLIIEIEQQLADSNRGEILRDGMKISIIGRPNSGKSTLLNYLAKRDIAIVSDIPGTTRDALSVSLNISGFPIILYDTAGIRETSEVIEKQGVRKAIEHAKESDINLWIIDGKEIKTDHEGGQFVEGVQEIEELIKQGKKTLIFVNKSDQISKSQQNVSSFKIGNQFYQIEGYISAQMGQNIPLLLKSLTKKIHERLDLTEGDASSIGNSIITQTRHRVELTKCLSHLKVFCNNQNHLTVDMVCEELRQAVNCIGRITGRVDVEEILDVIFLEFCIGK